MNDPRVALLIEFLRFPSVSTQTEHNQDLVDCAGWIRNRCEAIGLETRIIPTAGHPIVLAKSKPDPAKRTVLIYGHYDVQPPEPLEAWETPPFSPEIRNDRIYARGSTDNKGQILAHILGVEEALKRDGELPVNVIFLIEGEEEVGSTNLAAFLEANREELQCDVIVISDTGMAAHGCPTLSYALRGIAALELIVRGPSVDLHSGVFGGAVANPATAVARILSTLHNEDGHVMVEGFYDSVRPMADWERKAAAELPVTDDLVRELTGVSELFGEKGYSTSERVGARPTAEVNGVGGGYQGEGTKTVLPREAFAKLTFRLVPNQAPEEIIKLVEAHIRKHVPPGVTIEIIPGHGGEPYFFDPMSADGLAAQRALEQVFGKKTALMREGGSIPILTTFRNILGVDSILLALASPDCQAHGPNENFPIDNFLKGIELNQVALRELAKAKSA
jgi:acetylornithine deacetylase/succinyl-diaminopimelate desuccinylase-like protein